jgi:hypothetical protein
MRKGALPPAICRDSRMRRRTGVSRRQSRFVIAREKLRKRAPKVMKSLKRVNLCEGASALVPAATSQAPQGEFPLFWLTKPFESREHTSAKR